MEHRLTLGSNPRIIVLLLVVLAMFAVSVAGFRLLGAVYGLIFLALALFLGYQLGRFAFASFRSKVTTSNEGIAFVLPSAEREFFPWGQITHAGYCTQAAGKPFLFVYDENADRLITIPREYSDFDALIESVKEATPFESYALAKGDTIQALLRLKLGLGDLPSKN